MRILALDQSLSNTGYAIFNVNVNDTSYYLDKASTICIPSKLKDFNKKLNYIHNALSILIKDNDIDLIIYEGIFKHLNISTLIKLAKVQGIVELCASELNINSVIVTPKEWQAYFNLDKIKDNKNKSVDYINNLHLNHYINVNTDVNLDNINNHVADALCIGIYYIIYNVFK